MPARLPDEVKALLDAPNFWHLATVNPDGSPQSTVMCVGRRGERRVTYLVEPHRVWYRPPARR